MAMIDRSEESYGERGVTWVDRFGVWLSQRAIRRRLPRKEKLDVLDLGCGFHAGQLTALTDRLAHGTAVDFRIDGRLREHPKLTIMEAPVEEAVGGLQPEAFDVVMMISVLEHLAEPDPVLATVRSLLRPDGVLLINVPTWWGKWFLELSAFRLGLSPKVEMDDHKMYYDKRDLWPRLVAAGFRPSCIRMRYHKFGLNLFVAASK